MKPADHAAEAEVIRPQTIGRSESRRSSFSVIAFDRGISGTIQLFDPADAGRRAIPLATDRLGLGTAIVPSSRVQLWHLANS